MADYRDRPGYQKFRAAHEAIVRRAEERKAAGGDNAYEREQLPKHDFEDILMVDILTNLGKRYFKVKQCRRCEFITNPLGTTYEEGGLRTIPYRKPQPDTGCIKTIDKPADATVN